MPVFSGRHEEDGKRWLDMFLRFAACHCWSSAYKLMFVVYYLRDTALIWFENQNFQLWDSFVESFKKVYGNDLRRSRLAEDELRTRAQRAGESCHDYVQIILKLCREYNPNMSESEKVAHILKGIAENIFYLIFQKEFATVNEILNYCREMDDKLSKRIPQSHLLPRLPNTIAFPTYATPHEPVSSNSEPPTQHPVTSYPVCAHPTSFTLPPPVVSSIATDEDKITAIVEKVLQRVLPTHTAPSITAAISTRPNRDQRQCYYCGRT